MCLLFSKGSPIGIPTPPTCRWDFNDRRGGTRAGEPRSPRQAFNSIHLDRFTLGS